MGLLLVLLLLLLVVAPGWLPAAYALELPTATTTPRAPGAAADAPAADAAPARIVLGSLDPPVARPGKDVRIKGRVLASQPLQDAEVRIWLSEAITVRGHLQSAEEEELPRQRVVATAELAATTVPSGGRTTFSATLPADALDTGELRARVVWLELRASVAGADVERVAMSTAYVPWAPAEEVPAATRLAAVFPLTHRPLRGADDVFADESLLQAFDEQGGQLRLALEASAGWTLALDPMLVEDLALMADEEGYLVASEVGLPVRRPASAAAVQALAQLRSRAGVPGAVELLPYADPDVAALVAQGRRGEEQLAAAVDRAARVASDLLDVDLRPRIALPQAGTLDARTVAVLARAGLRTVVLPSAQVPADPQASATAAARTVVQLPQGVTSQALVSDDVLSGLVTGPATEQALSRLRAETAMHTAELPSAERGVVLAVPRGWRASREFVANLRSALEVPWVRPTALRTLADEPASDRRVALDVAPAAPVLDADYLAALEAHTTEGLRWARVMGLKEQVMEVREGYAGQGLRLQSLAAGEAGPALLAHSVADLAEQVAGLSIVSNDRITIPGSQSFPMTLRNDLEFRVRVAVSFGDSARVSVANTGVVSLQPGEALTVDVPVEAVANGTTDLPARLMTPVGTLFGETHTLRLTVRGAGGPAKVLVALAGVVFVLALAARILRRGRPAGTPLRGAGVVVAADGSASGGSGRDDPATGKPAPEGASRAEAEDLVRQPERTPAE